MNYEEAKDYWQSIKDEEYLKFERVGNKRTYRPDLHAFLLLSELAQSEEDIISAAEHDEIFLSPAVEEVFESATKEQLLELVRCGVRLDSYHSSFAMFV